MDRASQKRISRLTSLVSTCKARKLIQRRHRQDRQGFGVRPNSVIVDECHASPQAFKNPVTGSREPFNEISRSAIPDSHIGSMTARKLIVFDLEFTAWEGSLARHWLAPGEFKEVVQIGAVRLDGGQPGGGQRASIVWSGRASIPGLGLFRKSHRNHQRQARGGRRGFRDRLSPVRGFRGRRRRLPPSIMTNGCWRRISGSMD